MSDDHRAVLQTISDDGTTVGVNPYTPKLEPKIVSVSVDVAAVLKGNDALNPGAAFRTRQSFPPLPPDDRWSHVSFLVGHVYPFPVGHKYPFFCWPHASFPL